MVSAVTRQILDVLVRPETVAGRPMSFWSDAIPLLRRSGVLGPLAADTRPCWPGLPEKVVEQFQAALTVAARQHVLIAHELTELASLLAPATTKVVLLKGAAYQMLGLPNARGRLASDIDLLVSRQALPEVEARLLAHGWEHMNHSEYDQRYYRDWMHELPPLRHQERGTFLDLHHAISPPVSRVKVDTELLLRAAVPVRDTHFHVLAPADMVLHSVCHLMSESEFPSGLRDLCDIRELIRHYGNDSCRETFWLTLVERARAIGLDRYLYYVAGCLERHFSETLPAPARSRLHEARPAWPVSELMQWLITAVIIDRPRASAVQHAADRAMLTRGHFIRMPLHLLVPHLSRKAWLRWRNASPSA
jgi:Uncharacterised nucleotidyltransferase